MSSKNLTLVCVDASEHSKRALDWYFNSIHRDGDSVGLVHVHNLPDLPVGMGLHAGELLASDLYQQAVEQCIASSDAVVHKFQQLCEEKGVQPKVFKESSRDSIGNTICEIAKKNSATLIVVGQRGIGAIRRTLFGSVSDYVLHHTHIPVVVVPLLEKEKSRQSLTLICVDASEHSIRAFEFYYYNIYHTGDVVGLVHIHTVPDAPSLGLFGGGRAVLKVYLSNVEESIQESKSIIEKFEGLCLEKGISAKAFVQTMEDSVGHSICKIAVHENARHIIIGQRGLGMFRRNLMGSVSDYVIHHINIPVTIVTNPKKKK